MWGDGSNSGVRVACGGSNGRAGAGIGTGSGAGTGTGTGAGAGAGATSASTPGLLGAAGSGKIFAGVALAVASTAALLL